jgi:hypothetical protein
MFANSRVMGRVSTPNTPNTVGAEIVVDIFIYVDKFS